MRSVFSDPMYGSEGAYTSKSMDKQATHHVHYDGMSEEFDEVVAIPF